MAARALVIPGREKRRKRQNELNGGKNKKSAERELRRKKLARGRHSKLLQAAKRRLLKAPWPVCLSRQQQHM